MDVKIKAKCEARARTIEALSQPTRLFMVDELSRGERCVCELTEMVGDDISTISNHLSILRAAGIVAASWTAGRPVAPGGRSARPGGAKTEEEALAHGRRVRDERRAFADAPPGSLTNGEVE